MLNLGYLQGRKTKLSRVRADGNQYSGYLEVILGKNHTLTTVSLGYFETNDFGRYILKEPPLCIQTRLLMYLIGTKCNYSEAWWSQRSMC